MTCAYYPNVQTVRGRILGALLHGDSLTQQDALRRFSNFRLAADVEVLRKRGWAIDTKMIDVQTRDAGRKSEVARYSLAGDAIIEAGEVGREYAKAALAIEQQRRAA